MQENELRAMMAAAQPEDRELVLRRLEALAAARLAVLAGKKKAPARTGAIQSGATGLVLGAGTA